MALAKKIRNRIVGALVLVSLAMILVPAIMDPGQIYKRSSQSIAVNGNGAVTDSSGRLVQGDAHDYSDLLAPEQNNGVTPEQLAAQNSNSGVASESEQDSSLPLPPEPQGNDPFSAVNSSPQSLNVAPEQQVQRLKDAQIQQQAPQVQVTANQNVAKPKAAAQNSSSEVLRSNRSQSKPASVPSSERLVSSAQKTQKKDQGSVKSAVASSGAYAVQVGVFSSKANADSVVNKLRQAGISARQVPAVINGRNLIRVYAGSAATKNAAEGIANRVQQVTGTKGAVVNLGK